MKESDIFIEVDCFQKNKAGNIVCGDSYMSQKLKEEDRIISVLSDGSGSGIKASVLSAMTATMAMNYTAMNESILQTALSIIHTLPKDMVRKISYSTFCIFDIDCFGNTRIVEYESPAVYLFRRGQAVEIRKKKIPIEREDLENTYLWISEFKLEKEDRLICFSDGVSQSGMGSSNMPFGWDEGVGIYIAETLSQHPGISAKELARKIVLRAERNDNYRLLDDTSCCVIYRRTPRNLLICTGPPYDEKKDRYLAEKVRDFKGKKVVVTAGPTYEKIDPVRFIGNYSSGKMGLAIAEEFAGRGAEVVLVCGPVNLKTSHPAIRRVDVESAAQMYEVTSKEFVNSDVAVLSAAVADFTPKEKADHKIKRGKDDLLLELLPTKDIAAELGRIKTASQLLVGFALETNDEEVNALSKMQRKNLDMIVLNSLNDKGAGFSVDTNKVTILDKAGDKTVYELKTKVEVAKDIVDQIAFRL